MNEDSVVSELTEVEEHLRRISEKTPGNVRFRIVNSLNHFAKAKKIIEVDREMASFRARTGEEEAATALMLAIATRRYPEANLLNPRSHQHKAAVLACVSAIKNDLAPVLKEFQVIFNFEKGRVDVKVPLSNFNVIGGEKYAIQPVEPLDLVHSRPNSSENIFKRALDNLASLSNFPSIKNLVSSQANSRNTLLYASDAALPESRATIASIDRRQWNAVALLILSVMVLQSKRHQALVCQAITAFAHIIGRLPQERLG